MQSRGEHQSFDLDAEAARLRAGGIYSERGRSSVTLRGGWGMSVALLVLKGEEALQEHAAPGPISVLVREGRIRFTAASETDEAGPETVLSCDSGVRHAVEAVDDADCHITIALPGGHYDP